MPLSKIETELKVVKATLLNSPQGCFVRVEQIEDSIRNGVIKKAWNPEESFGKDKYSFHQHLKLHALSQIHRCKVRDRQHENHNVPDAHIALDANILKVITLLDVPIRLVTFPAGQVIFHPN